MRRSTGWWSVCIAALAVCWVPLQAQQAARSSGRLLVLVEPSALALPPGLTRAALNRVQVTAPGLRTLLERGRVQEVHQLHPHWTPMAIGPSSWKVKARRKGDTMQPDELTDLSYWYVLDLADTLGAADLVKQLNAAKGVVYAEPDAFIAAVSHPVTLQPSVPLAAEPSGLLGRLAVVLSANDPAFGQQWGLFNSTNRAGDIRAPEAWDIQTGSTGVRLSFMDTGIDGANPDFTGKLTAQYDFVHNDANAYPDANQRSPGHGVATAGIAAAHTNDGVGAAGVCGGSGANLGCPILAAKILGDLSIVQGISEWLGLTSMAASGTTWSVNNGARVISNTWCADRGAFGIGNDRSVHDAMRNAHGAGVLITAAMGNSDGGCNQTAPSQQVAPAAWSDIVMSVGASTRSGTRVDLAATGGFWESGVGPHISVIAPGLGSYSTALGGPPASFSGTSEATPFVTGVAGLVMSEAAKKGYQLTSLDVRRIIEGTATDKDVAGFDNNTGWGLINAEKALKVLQAPNQLNFVSFPPVTSTCFAQTSIMSWTFWADWAVLQARRCELRKTILFPKRYTTPPLVWGRPIANGGVTPSNPNSQVYFTGVVPGTVTTTGVTLRTYVYERWNLSGQSLGWYPVQPSQVNWAYGVLGEPAPLPAFTVEAGAPGVVTVKSTYPLTGGASDPASNWKWERSDNGGATWSLWASAQNSQFIAYAGQYTIRWRLSARRNSDGATAQDLVTTQVCIPTGPACLQ
jgi:thermitase